MKNLYALRREELIEEVIALRCEMQGLYMENERLEEESTKQVSLIVSLVDTSDYMKLQLIISGALTIPEKKSA